MGRTPDRRERSCLDGAHTSRVEEVGRQCIPSVRKVLREPTSHGTRARVISSISPRFRCRGFFRGARLDLLGPAELTHFWMERILSGYRKREDNVYLPFVRSYASPRHTTRGLVSYPAYPLVFAAADFLGEHAWISLAQPS